MSNFISLTNQEANTEAENPAMLRFFTICKNLLVNISMTTIITNKSTFNSFKLTSLD